ncbi:hypothetical protein R6Q57_009147 [Mikania cordata]
MDHSKSDNHIQYNPIQPENLNSIPSSQSFQNANPRHASVKPVLNCSIGTGEELSLEFMRDLVNPRMAFVPYPAGDPSHTHDYLELKGILGISHTASGSGSDMSMVNIVERGSNHLENNHQSSSGFNSTHGSNSSSKIKILCSFGGKILSRPSDGKLRYVGGNTRIIRISKDIYWRELHQKALEIYIETYAIKYQLPGEDLDALVSVSSDEDLQNMMEECNLLGIGEGSQKLRLFLFSLSDFDETTFSHGSSGGDNEFEFLVAVNGMDASLRQELTMHSLMTSSANNLSDLDSQNVERNTSPLNFVDFNVSSTNAYRMHHGEPILETSVPEKVEKPKNDSYVKQEVKQANVRSPRDDVASAGVLPAEGKLPPKPKVNEERHQDQIDAKAAASNENDFGTAGSAVDPNSSGSDLIDLSYLESPSRVYHSERIPCGQSEKNRLTKSDDTLGSQLLAAHLQSDVDPISELVGSFHTEDLPPQITHGGLVNYENQAGNDAVTGGHQPSSTPNVVSQPARGDVLIDINDQFHSDFLSDAFARAISDDSNGIGILPQDGAGLSMNIANHEPQRWSFFQKLAQNELQNKDVSLIDQDHLAFLYKDQNAQEEASVRYNVSQFPDDEENEILGSESTSMQPRYNPSLMENSEGTEKLRMPYSEYEVTHLDDLAENLRMPYSEYEVETRNDSLPSIDLSLGDLDIGFLQIIRNEDLEELKELGSGTFGTVYHGKWRGTDVAIKRIKKSCFAGQSSEQERLTVEFWREAVILSKLHHPNVMAFYGVVQDGPDGTLATVRVHGGVRGSLPWMAPELLNGGSNKVSEKAKSPFYNLVDVFSFGIVLWEIHTREEPYANMHYGAIIGGIVNNTLRPVIPSDCDPEWRRLMEECWALDPAVRPSFTEITNQLCVMSAAYQNKAHAHKPS